jgi:hypothetical protein
MPGVISRESTRRTSHSRRSSSSVSTRLNAYPAKWRRAVASAAGEPGSDASATQNDRHWDSSASRTAVKRCEEVT